MLHIQIEKFFAKSFTDKDGFLQITIPPGAYEVESLNFEIKRNITDEEPFTEACYPIRINPKFSTLSSMVEISRRKPLLVFSPMIVLETF